MFFFATLTLVAFALSTMAANDGVYLANCAEFTGENGAIDVSQMDYYNNAKQDSQDGQLPDDSTDVSVGEYIIWEGEEVVSFLWRPEYRVTWKSSELSWPDFMVRQCGVFEDTGVQFCSNISADGQSLVSVLVLIVSLFGSLQ
jgi:hypothetical protein